jgi:sugar (pentulose or hexulose) kinase
MADENHVLVLDIGKTNVKCHVLNNDGNTVWMDTTPNSNAGIAPYPHFDVDADWDWLLHSARRIPARSKIAAINVSTHGAAAALLNSAGDLALPVLDYEYGGVEECAAAYQTLRPEFAATYSPRLPAGLNLGLQIYWLQERFPDSFATVRHVLMYPQYWVWRISGKAVTEVTSLGCHTDLWLPRQRQYSSLVDNLDIRHLLPPVVVAHESVGTISPGFAHETGLPAGCRVFAGVHDSSASLARYLYAGGDTRFAVVSAGTWVVSMNLGASLDVLAENKDMLANTSILGDPVPCARFMGGREVEEVCRLTNSELTDDCDLNDVQHLIDDRVFATPSFTGFGGPFPSAVGGISGSPGSGKALALLYMSLMIDYELDLLQSSRDVIFGSAAEKNTLVCELLAQLRPEQNILVADSVAATVTGAWCLTRWDEPPPPQFDRYESVPPPGIRRLAEYRAAWRSGLALTNGRARSRPLK